MATFYDDSTNEGNFCNLEGNALMPSNTWVPKFVLVRSKIAKDALELGYTSWDVYEALQDFQKDKPDEIKELLEPCKNWALAAALRGDNGAETSKLAYILTPISGAPATVRRAMKNRLVGTLGEHRQPQPVAPPPPFQNKM